MSEVLNIVVAQENFLVGAVKQNTQKILDVASNHHDADIIVFPELSLTGYPPEDLLYRDDLQESVEQALVQITDAQLTSSLVIGHPWRDNDLLYNAVSVISGGEIICRYFKQQLPNYGVFDEKRYFAAGTESASFMLKGHHVGVLICEDLWFEQPVKALSDVGVDLILAPNASPYEQGKFDQRTRVVSDRVNESGIPVLYVNHVCGQDELVFDGQSFAMNADGLALRLPAFEQQQHTIHFANSRFEASTVAEPLCIEAEVYQALVLGTRDYIAKNGFKGAVLGLSGGIDSALTLAVAVDAIGAENVHAVMMPFRYTSEMSVDDAAKQALDMGVTFDNVSIEAMYDSFLGQLAPIFGDRKKDTTEENLQARIRGVLLMSISNKTGKILLTTSNKSESAVGYCTLYGDMCGGFAVIKDLPKTLVYRVSAWRNTVSPVIPERVITRPPSAELAPDQIDEDSLPPYDELDTILEMYVEQDKSLADIIAAGFNEEVVTRILRLVDINEYKRRQAAPGPKVTSRNFNKDRRNPITSGFGRERVS